MCLHCPLDQCERCLKVCTVPADRVGRLGQINFFPMCLCVHRTTPCPNQLTTRHANEVDDRTGDLPKASPRIGNSYRHETTCSISSRVVVRPRLNRMAPMPISGGTFIAFRNLHAREPKFTEAADQAKWQGMVTLKLVVDQEGIPEQIRVVGPLGCGLDAEAVRTPGLGRFKPRAKDGYPLAVEIALKMEFRRYWKPMQPGPCLQSRNRNQRLENENSQYFLSTPITLPCTSTTAAGTVIGFIFTFDGCSRILSPSR